MQPLNQMVRVKNKMPTITTASPIRGTTAAPATRAVTRMIPSPTMARPTTTAMVPARSCLENPPFAAASTVGANLAAICAPDKSTPSLAPAVGRANRTGRSDVSTGRAATTGG